MKSVFKDLKFCKQNKNILQTNSLQNVVYIVIIKITFCKRGINIFIEK